MVAPPNPDEEMTVLAAIGLGLKVEKQLGDSDDMGDLAVYRLCLDVADRHPDMCSELALGELPNICLSALG